MSRDLVHTSTVAKVETVASAIVGTNKTQRREEGEIEGEMTNCNTFFNSSYI